MIRISAEDRLYIDQLRGISISRIVLGHLGLFWLFPPYTQFLHALLPLLFFISGGVSFFSFRRADSAGTFLARRMARLLIPYYLVALIAFALLWWYSGKIPAMGAEELLLWLTVSPPPETMPFPLGQIWFLHTLAGITLFSPVVFRAMERNNMVPLLLIGFSLLLAFWRILSPVHRDLDLLGHDLYEPLVCCGFFFFGAMVYSGKELFRPSILQLTGIVGAAAAAGLVFLFDFSINLADHAYKPDLYYVAMGYAAIALMLVTEGFWSHIFRRLKWLNDSLLFVSRHAYSIFLLHTFFIFASEKWLGLISVAGDPLRASLKIVLVCAATAICAVPLSQTSNFCINRLDNFFIPRQKAPGALSQKA